MILIRYAVYVLFRLQYILKVMNFKTSWLVLLIIMFVRGRYVSQHKFQRNLFC